MPKKNFFFALTVQFDLVLLKCCTIIDL